MPAPLIMFAHLLLQNPELLSKLPPPSERKAPAVNAAKFGESLVDASKEILKCYHKTANFQQVDTIKGKFDRQSQYGATNSMGIRIRYTGAMTSNPYEMTVAVMVKPGNVRTVVIQDNAKVKFDRKCQLEDWVSVGQPAAKTAAK
jgi:hypothetical protein